MFLTHEERWEQLFPTLPSTPRSSKSCAMNAQFLLKPNHFLLTLLLSKPAGIFIPGTSRNIFSWFYTWPSHEASTALVWPSYRGANSLKHGVVSIQKTQIKYFTELWEPNCPQRLLPQEISEYLSKTGIFNWNVFTVFLNLTFPVQPTPFQIQK